MGRSTPRRARGRRRGRRGRPGLRASRGTWVKVALIALILYVAGVLVPLAAWVFAVQRDVLESAWSTGNVLLFALAVAVALALGLVGWIKRLAQRV